jgi:type IV secretion system protein VirB9
MQRRGRETGVRSKEDRIMNRLSMSLLGSSALLAACAPTAPPSLIRAEPAEPPTLEVVVAPDALPAFKPTLKPLDDGADNETAEATGLSAIEAAHQGALIQSAPDGFINASQYFAYQEGALYELHTAPGFITTIALKPGERLVNYAIGDTARWVVGDVLRGDQTLLLVKPTRPKLGTNLVITTDQRVYLLEASSHKGATYNASIAWTYPKDEIASQIAAIEQENARRAETVIAGVPVDQLSFDYEIEGDKPRWRPLRAFDDGAKVYIEFPEELATSEAPPLFVSDTDGARQLVNYRVRNRYYVIDRLFDVAELRLDDTVVTVRKDKGFSWQRFFTRRPDGGHRSLRRDPDDHGERGYGKNDKTWG